MLEPVGLPLRSAVDSAFEVYFVGIVPKDRSVMCHVSSFYGIRFQQIKRNERNERRRSTEDAVALDTCHSRTCCRTHRQQFDTRTSHNNQSASSADCQWRYILGSMRTLTVPCCECRVGTSSKKPLALL